LNDSQFGIDAMEGGSVIKTFFDELLKSLNHLWRNIRIEFDDDLSKVARVDYSDF
jgi:hypothetical protein